MVPRCPYCLAEVKEFAKATAKDGSVAYKCEACSHLVPAQYAVNPDNPIIVSLIGRKAHGKTAYLISLLYTLYQPSDRWGALSCTPVDGSGMEHLKSALAGFRSGPMPPKTQEREGGLTEPVLHHLTGLPWARECWLLMYDADGAWFVAKKKEAFTGRAAYPIRSPVVVLLLSLDENDFESPEDPQEVLVAYRDALRARGIEPKDRTLLVVLTKADTVRDRAGLPPVVRTYLDGDEDPLKRSGFERLEEMSSALEKWLEEDFRTCAPFVRDARRELGTVKYCAVSAFGSEPDKEKEQLRITPAPRGVLVPLYWLWGLLHVPPVWLNGVRYCSLEHAAARARDGEVIELEEGTYTLSRPLHLQRGIRLVGQGLERKEETKVVVWKTKVVGNTPDYLLRYDGAGTFRAEGILFGHRGKVPASVIEVTRGTVELSQCAVLGAKMDEEKHSGGVGVDLGGKVRATLTSCFLQKNDSCGLFAWGQARADLDGCDFRENGVAGFAYGGQATGTVNGGKCLQNYHGAYVFGDAAPVLEETVCEGNTKYGIYFAGSAAGRAIGTQCNQNKSHGFVILEKARPELRDIVCRANKGIGLWIGPAASPTLGTYHREGNEGGDLEDERSPQE